LQITKDDIEKGLAIWRYSKISISKAFEEGVIEAARAVASDNIDSYYGYNLGPVLFKPTDIRSAALASPPACRIMQPTR
jgi:hypothetical protein